MRQIYFDNAASTRPFSCLIENSAKLFSELYANPSSPHKLGLEAERSVKNATDILKQTLNADNYNIIYTSGGTESNNMAILGTALSRKKRANQIITTSAEHSSVAEVFKYLSKEDFEVIYLNVDSRGYVDIKQLQEYLNPNTAMVSIHHVNSETGTVQNINEIADTVKRINPNTCVHVDGVQAFGKIKVNLKNIDCYSVSAHKIHAFKGVGALFVKKDFYLLPLFYGGGQQSGLRPGTENVPGVVTFAEAAKINYHKLNENSRHVATLKAKLAGITETFPFITVNGDPENASPYILNLSFNRVNAPILVNLLESKGIYCSTGSACGSKKSVSPILKSYGIVDKSSITAVRFSFSQFNTEDEVQYCLDVLTEILPRLCV